MGEVDDWLVEKGQRHLSNLKPLPLLLLLSRQNQTNLSCLLIKMCGSSSLLMMLILLTFAGFSQGGNGGVTMELWCVAKNNAEDAALQSAIDWACGPGGADCGPIQQGGPCYDPADVVRTASYPFNDYYLRHGLNQDSCDFDNTAALTSLNPSRGSCKFPSRKWRVRQGGRGEENVGEIVSFYFSETSENGDGGSWENCG